jgi:hypothetical protein
VQQHQQGTSAALPYELFSRTGRELSLPKSGPAKRASSKPERRRDGPRKENDGEDNQNCNCGDGQQQQRDFDCQAHRSSRPAREVLKLNYGIRNAQPAWL